LWKCFLIAAVDANLKSVSILILRTPFLIPSCISLTGTPYVSFINPPKSLIIFIRSCGTDDEPCITRCVFGNLLFISLILLIASVSPVGGLANL
jgi:hypothetical protein